jgi:hypothetical protein
MKPINELTKEQEDYILESSREIFEDLHYCPLCDEQLDKDLLREDNEEDNLYMNNNHIKVFVCKNKDCKNYNEIVCIEEYDKYSEDKNELD